MIIFYVLIISILFQLNEAVLSCYTGSGFGKVSNATITQCVYPANTYCLLTTISNSSGTRYIQSCYDSNCNSSSYSIENTNYVTKCCLTENCNIFPQKKFLSCWVGGSYYGYITTPTKTECTEFDNEYCSLYIGIKTITSTMIYYYQSCSSSCYNVNMTFDDIFYMNLCCQTDFCNVYPRSNLPTATISTTEAQSINSTSKFKNDSFKSNYLSLKLFSFSFFVAYFIFM